MLTNSVVPVTLCLLLTLSCLRSVTAHSWLDCSNFAPTKKPGQTAACKGFPLGYPSRANPDINTLYTYLIQGRPASAKVCQPGRQDIRGNNPFPPANVRAGQSINLQWQPNGHLNEGKPTQVEIHWTARPDTVLKTRSQLGPKTLLTSMPFASRANCDDPSNPNTLCHGRVRLPKKTLPGRYTLVWWWRFDQNPIGEEYSTCFEVLVKPAAPAKARL